MFDCKLMCFGDQKKKKIFWGNNYKKKMTRSTMF